MCVCQWGMTGRCYSNREPEQSAASYCWSFFSGHRAPLPRALTTLVCNMCPLHAFHLPHPYLYPFSLNCFPRAMNMKVERQSGRTFLSLLSLCSSCWCAVNHSWFSVLVCWCVHCLATSPSDNFSNWAANHLWHWTMGMHGLVIKRPHKE